MLLIHPAHLMAPCLTSQVRNLNYLNRDLEKVLLITANPDAHALQPDNAVKVCPLRVSIVVKLCSMACSAACHVSHHAVPVSCGVHHISARRARGPMASSLCLHPRVGPKIPGQVHPHDSCPFVHVC